MPDYQQLECAPPRCGDRTTHTARVVRRVVLMAWQLRGTQARRG